MSVSRRSFAFDLATLCAPTLAGLKPASLFRYQPCAGQDGCAMAAAWHAALCDRGVAVRVLKACPRTGAVLVYVYRPAQIEALLKNSDVRRFLCSEGYCPGTADELLAQLSQRLCCEGDFPHEIGIFLGYPLEDVKGFIDNKGKNCQSCGSWKVYCNAGEKEALFDKYRKCTRIYRQVFEAGRKLPQMTVVM